MVEIRVVDCKKFRKAILHHHMCRILRKNMSFLRQFASFANLCVVFVEFYDLTSTIQKTYILLYSDTCDVHTYANVCLVCVFLKRNLFRFIKSKYFTPIQLYDQIKLIYSFILHVRICMCVNFFLYQFSSRLQSIKYCFTFKKFNVCML